MIRPILLILALATLVTSQEMPQPHPAVVDKFAEGSESREMLKLYGNVAAAFTPVNSDLELDFTNLNLMAARLESWGVLNVMLGGTTGESVSFTIDERKRVVLEWLKIAP